jgi:hypothetical protein
VTQKDKEIARLTELDDIRFIMGSPEGRRFMWRLLSDGACFHSCFDPNAIIMGARASRKDFVLRYFNDVMQISTELYLQMVKENQVKGKE